MHWIILLDYVFVQMLNMVLKASLTNICSRRSRPAGYVRRPTTNPVHSKRWQPAIFLISSKHSLILGRVDILTQAFQPSVRSPVIKETTIAGRSWVLHMKDPSASLWPTPGSLCVALEKSSMVFSLRVWERVSARVRMAAWQSKLGAKGAVRLNIWASL